MAQRWDREGLRLHSRAMTPGFGQAEFALLYRAARPVLPDLWWFVGRLSSAFLLPPDWEGWPLKATPFADLVRGLRAEGAHAVAEAPGVLDRAAGYVRDDTNELYGFTARPDWMEVARRYERHRTHPELLAGCAVAFLNADAAHWSCYAGPEVLDTAEGALQGLAGARVERVRFSRDLGDEERRAMVALEAEGGAS